MRKIILVPLFFLFCLWLFADADTIRTGVLNNMPGFGPSRTPSDTHGNLYGKGDTAIIVARYSLSIMGLPSEPEHIEVTRFTKVTFVLDGYPLNNKIVIDWGDYTVDPIIINQDITPTYVEHQYLSQVCSYNVTIKTYHPSSNTYIEEPEHEIDYVVGIFPYDEIEEVATVDGQTVGNLTQYQTTIAGSIKKPVLIVEGFNLHSNNTVSSIIGLNPDFYQNLLSDGYDLYILTFEDSENSLFVNAGLVLSALQRIKAHYAEGGDLAGFGCTPIKLIGYSMGGVLARIALASAEDENGYAHGCNLLLTVDSPHRGFVVNSHLQDSLQDIVDLVEDFSAESTDIINELIEISDSPIARQLIRNNVNAESLPYDFIDGSNEYTNVFDFLNPCDAHNVDHLNQDVDYSSSANYDPQMDFKSGFPWKQNRIRKYAVAFGEHEAIGNTENHSSFANAQVKWKVLGIPSNHTLLNIEDEWFDKCPSSYFPTEFHFQQKIDPGTSGNATLDQVIEWIIDAFDMKVKLDANYNMPVIPIISSLCITNRSFAEPHQTQYIPYSQTITEPVQTPFDQYYIPYTAKSHQVLSSDCAQWIRLNMIDDPQSHGIIGHISGTMLYGSQLIANQPFVLTNLNSGTVYNVTSSATGIIQINNLYINNCVYEIKHAGGLYYPQLITVNVDMFGNSEMGNVVFTSPGSYVEVNPSPTSNACHTISNAFELCKGSNISHIILREGTYRENVYVTDIGFNAQSFILEGDGSTVIIHSKLAAPPLRLWQFNHHINELIIRNIIFEDSDDSGGGGPSFNGSIGHVTMENCTVRDCGDNAYISQVDVPVGLVSNVPIHINDCDFYNIVGEMHGSTNRSLGAIYLYVNQDTQPSIIENCRIHDNSAGNASAIYVGGNGRFIIQNNIIRNNFQKLSDSNYCIRIKNARDVEIRHNIIDHNWYETAVGSPEYAIGLVRTDSNVSNVLLENNTITFHRRALYIWNVNVNMINNLIDVMNIGIHCESGFDQSMLRYVNNFMKYYANTDPAVNYDLYAPSNTGNLYGDPQIDASFQPIWNSTIMSPCIDTGTGEDDPDGTPPDIGAITAIPHKDWEYTFSTQADLEKWYWVSYPVLNSRTNNMLKASEFFKEILSVHSIEVNGHWQDTPTFLDEIDWMEGGDPYPTRLYWDVLNWSDNQSTHNVSSPQGYKIKMLPRTPSVVTLRESGFRTPSDLQFPIYGGTENWLGYFKDQPAWPHEAFASIWDDINMIKTKNWCIVRANPIGDYWGMHGKVSTLKDGDMVIVTTNNDHNTFQWTNTDITEGETKALPEHFVFNEKQDYVPVFVSLPDSLMIDLKEIGLYLDGICKGAVVIESNIEQICAYLDIDEKLTDGVVDFVFYYNDDKSQHQERKTIRMDSSRFKARYVNDGTRYPFYDISITKADLDNVIPPEFSLSQNYPNPFNPSTTISYQLPESGNIRLEIYNLKGQLVQTLVEANQEAGAHSVIWNGTDANNRGVASGVYFYRLSSPSKTSSKRMLLIK